jgi:Flp pilus assembly protein TadG
MRTAPSSSPARGFAAVEFGLVSTLLVTMLLGASEFGRAMYQYDTLVKSARAGVRYLSTAQAGDSTAITAAQNLVVCGSTASCGTPLVPGLTTGMVTVCDAVSCPGTCKRQSTGQSQVNLVVVTVTGLQFQPMASWILPAFTFDTIVATMTQGTGA